MKTLFNFLQYSVLVAVFILMGVFSFWYLYPYNVIDFQNEPFPILNDNGIVLQGEKVRYLVSYCKHINVTAEVVRYFVDGVLFETPETLSIGDIGCHTVIAEVAVPATIPKSKFKLKTVLRYRVNPIRVIEVTNYTQPFLIK